MKELAVTAVPIQRAWRDMRVHELSDPDFALMLLLTGENTA